MSGLTLRIEHSSRAHAESLHALLEGYQSEILQNDGAWQLEVQLGELAELLLNLFETLGAWLESEHVDSLLLHFDERQFTLLRPSKERLADSAGFLLERVAQLETALNSRVLIEQAKGILAVTLDCDPEQAFGLLRAAARAAGTNIRELSIRIVASPRNARELLG